MWSLIRRQPDTAPRDPAPSRWTYRYQRLMLTPGFRASMRIGVPIALVAIIAASWFSHKENRTMLSDQITQAKQGLQQRPQFMVRRTDVTGVAGVLATRVEDILTVDFPISSFDLDLEALRKSVEALDPVKSASVRVGDGGALIVDVAPRKPAALWRDVNVLRLIDGDGVFAGTVETRTERLDLPLIAGDGAEQNIVEALELYAQAGPLQDRIRGLVRMGERRWDIVLDRDQRILLPGDGAVAALDRVIALDAAQDMLDRDVGVVDMRNEARPTLRMNEEAAAALRRVNDNKEADE